MRFLKLLLALLIVTIVALTSLSACSPAPKVELEKLSSITVFYTDAENKTQFVDFDADSEELASLKTWLAENKNGWERYLATPSMGDISITSQGMSMNIGNDWLILREDTTKDKVRQLRKEISVSDLEVFKSLR